MTADLVTIAWAAYLIAFEAVVILVFVRLYRLAPPAVETRPARCVECRGKLEDDA